MIGLLVEGWNVDFENLKWFNVKSQIRNESWCNIESHVQSELLLTSISRLVHQFFREKG